MAHSISQCIANAAISHNIPLGKANMLYENAYAMFGEEKLLQKLPSGIYFNHALERGYEMSKNEPDKLKQFVAIFANKHDVKKSFLKFGTKPAQQDIMS